MRVVVGQREKYRYSSNISLLKNKKHEKIQQSMQKQTHSICLKSFVNHKSCSRTTGRIILLMSLGETEHIDLYVNVLV